MIKYVLIRFQGSMDTFPSTTGRTLNCIIPDGSAGLISTWYGNNQPSILYMSTRSGDIKQEEHYTTDRARSLPTVSHTDGLKLSSLGPG